MGAIACVFSLIFFNGVFLNSAWLFRRSYSAEKEEETKSFSLSSKTAECPWPYGIFDSTTNYCYLRSRYTYSWKYGLRICAVIGGRLAILDSQKKEFLKNNRDADDNKYHWVGIRKSSNSEWLSIDGTSVNSAGHAGTDDSNKNCGAENDAGNWEARNCDDKYPIICERVPKVQGSASGDAAEDSKKVSRSFGMKDESMYSSAAFMRFTVSSMIECSMYCLGESMCNGFYVVSNSTLLDCCLVQYNTAYEGETTETVSFWQ